MQNLARQVLSAIIIGIISFGLTFFASAKKETDGWYIAGFDEEQQVIDAIDNIRNAANSGSIRPIAGMLAEVPFAMNCFDDNTGHQTGSIIISQYEQLARVWKYLVATSEKFRSLRDAELVDVSYNSNGASLPLGTIWFAPIQSGGKAKTTIISINTFETCAALIEVH